MATIAERMPAVVSRLAAGLSEGRFDDPDRDFLRGSVEAGFIPIPRVIAALAALVGGGHGPRGFPAGWKDPPVRAEAFGILRRIGAWTDPDCWVEPENETRGEARRVYAAIAREWYELAAALGDLTVYEPPGQLAGRLTATDPAWCVGTLAFLPSGLLAHVPPVHLLPALRHPEPAVRAWAARLVLRCGDPEPSWPPKGG